MMVQHVIGHSHRIVLFREWSVVNFKVIDLSFEMSGKPTSQLPGLPGDEFQVSMQRFVSIVNSVEVEVKPAVVKHNGDVLPAAV